MSRGSAICIKKCQAHKQYVSTRCDGKKNKPRGNSLLVTFWRVGMESV